MKTEFKDFKNEIHGYIKNESDIYELTIADCFERYLINKNVLFKRLQVKNLYNITSRNQVTDFDGLFLINCCDEKVYQNNVNYTRRNYEIFQKSIENNSYMSQTRKQSAKTKLNERQNKLINTRPTLVIIEAKHEVNKKLIDNKILQLKQICQAFDDGKRVQLYPQLLKTASDNFRTAKF